MCALLERNKDLETRLALATVNFEELEIKIETFSRKISQQDDEIENYLRNETKLKECVNNITKENEDLKVLLMIYLMT